MELGRDLKSYMIFIDFNMARARYSYFKDLHRVYVFFSCNVNFFFLCNSRSNPEQNKDLYRYNC